MLRNSLKNVKTVSGGFKSTCRLLLRGFSDKKDGKPEKVDLSQLPPKAFLKWELENNPEFDKAFPALSKYKPKTKLEKTKLEPDFVESLTFQYRMAQKQSFDDTQVSNVRNFVEGYGTPQGPLKWMSQEEKDKVHQFIDEKLDQLAATGLSKEEILYPEKRLKGLPLNRDPFFLYLRKNRLARELLIKQGETLTVDKIVDLALRQDIGPDPSYSRAKQDYVYKNKLTFGQEDSLANNYPLRGDKQVFDNSSYEGTDYARRNDMMKDLKNEHVMQQVMPVRRRELRRSRRRTLNWFDIHWRNTELLHKFLNSAGKIKSRWKTRLSLVQQRKVAKAIKRARKMILLPTASNVKPADKRSLRTLQDDIDDNSKKLINLETGHIYVMDPQEKREAKDREKVDLSDVPQDFKQEEMNRLKDLEFDYMPPMPNDSQFSIVKANHYAKVLKKQELASEGYDIEQLQITKVNSKINAADESYKFMIKRIKEPKAVSDEEAKAEYVKLEEKLMNCESDEFFELFVSELAADTKNLEQTVKDGDNERSARGAAKVESIDVDSILKEIADLKRNIFSNKVESDTDLVSFERNILQKFKGN